MGIYAIDFFTFGHFAGGVLSRLAIYPEKKWLSFIIGIILHTLVELIEHEYNPINGKIIETKINKIFDIIFYLIGWFIADFFYDKLKLKGIYYYYGLFVLIFGIIIEFLREIFPYNKFLSGAFTK
jgi:hypothetical protein